MENPIKEDDLGVPLFQETTIWRFVHVKTIQDHSRPVFFLNVNVNGGYWMILGDLGV